MGKMVSACGLSAFLTAIGVSTVHEAFGYMYDLMPMAVYLGVVFGATIVGALAANQLCRSCIFDLREHAKEKGHCLVCEAEQALQRRVVIVPPPKPKQKKEELPLREGFVR